jgi:hypothetical protein
MIAAQVVALFFAPLPPIERAPAGALRSGPESALPSAGSASANPFRIARAGPVGSGPGAGATRLEESALNLKLYGAWRGPGGTRAAIAVGDGAQALFAEGEEVANGIKLVAVHDEYVVVSRQGHLGVVSIVNRVAPSSREKEIVPPSGGRLVETDGVAIGPTAASIVSGSPAGEPVGFFSAQPAVSASAMRDQVAQEASFPEDVQARKPLSEPNAPR